jgi:hypothetical protein
LNDNEEGDVEENPSADEEDGKKLMKTEMCNLKKPQNKIVICVKINGQHLKMVPESGYTKCLQNGFVFGSHFAHAT